jgi:hypothetical protein
LLLLKFDDIWATAGVPGTVKAKATAKSEACAIIFMTTPGL